MFDRCDPAQKDFSGNGRMTVQQVVRKFAPLPPAVRDDVGKPCTTPVLPPLVDRSELVALLEDLASVNLSREACARQANRMADDLITRGLTFTPADGGGK